MSGSPEMPPDESQSKKRRFASLEDRELEDLLDSAQSKKTKYSTMYTVGVFNDWARQREIGKKLDELRNEELDVNLRLFYAEARNKAGEEYGKSTLLGFRNGIERYLNYPPHNRGIKFNGNPLFKSSNVMLDAKIRNLRRMGKEKSSKYKMVIIENDLRRLKKHFALSFSTPLGLLRNVWFHTTLFWCRKGQGCQRNLTKNSIDFKKDEMQRAYAMLGQDVKNNLDTLSRLYQTEHLSDGYNALQLYISKLNPACEAFYQLPKRKWTADDLVWYENRPLGVNKLAEMMKEIGRAAKLEQKYTNQALKTTEITSWLNTGFTSQPSYDLRSAQSLMNITFPALPTQPQQPVAIAPSSARPSQGINVPPVVHVLMLKRQVHVQKPEVMFITCIDSRVMPTTYTSTSPGQMFIVRNVGNIVPHAKLYGLQGGCSSETAALEFAIVNNGIHHVAVCGHSNCKAIENLCSTAGDSTASNSMLSNWIKTNGQPLLAKYDQLTANDGKPLKLLFNNKTNTDTIEAIIDKDNKLSTIDKVSQINVLQQLHNINSYSFAHQRIQENQLHLHALWFDIGSAQMYMFSKECKTFEPINQDTMNTIFRTS